MVIAIECYSPCRNPMVEYYLTLRGIKLGFLLDRFIFVLLFSFVLIRYITTIEYGLSIVGNDMRTRLKGSFSQISDRDWG